MYSRVTTPPPAAPGLFFRPLTWQSLLLEALCHWQSAKNRFLPVLCAIIWTPELIFPVSGSRGHRFISAVVAWFTVRLLCLLRQSLGWTLVCDLETAAVPLSWHKMGLFPFFRVVSVWLFVWFSFPPFMPLSITLGRGCDGLRDRHPSEGFRHGADQEGQKQSALSQGRPRGRKELYVDQLL